MVHDLPTSFSGNERFEVLAKLGSGGMGVVYAALDRYRQERVAIKTLHAEDPGALLRLKNEFRALQDLQHPNLVSLGELFHEQGQWFFTMELIDGVDFISYVRGGHGSAAESARVERVPDQPADQPADAASTDPADPADRLLQPPPPREREGGASGADLLAAGDLDPGPRSFDELKLRACLIQLAEGLAAIHAGGRVHRDIKPGNILVDPGGRLVLLDFGLVTHEEPGEKSAEHLFPLGTVAYMSPEQAASQEVTAATDWYGVGVLLYQSLTGQLPFSGPAITVLMDKQRVDPRRPRELAPGVPRDLDDLCAALLDREPRRRPQAEQVIAAAGAQRSGRCARRVASLAPTSRTLFIGRQRELAAMFDAFSAVDGGATASRAACTASRGWGRASCCAPSPGSCWPGRRTRWCCTVAAMSGSPRPSRPSTAWWIR